VGGGSSVWPLTFLRDQHRLLIEEIYKNSDKQREKKENAQGRENT
jgi:hypothetical protein